MGIEDLDLSGVTEQAKELGADIKSGLGEAKAGVQYVKGLYSDAKGIADMVSGKKDVPDGFHVIQIQGQQQKQLAPIWVPPLVEYPSGGGAPINHNIANRVLWEIWVDFRNSLDPSEFPVLIGALAGVDPWDVVRYYGGTAGGDPDTLPFAMRNRYYGAAIVQAVAKNFMNVSNAESAAAKILHHVTEAWSHHSEFKWWVEAPMVIQAMAGIATGTLEIGAESLPQDAAAVGGVSAAECLLPEVPYGNARSSCIDSFADQDPGVRQALLSAGNDNIMSIADPSKPFQAIKAIDGNRYLVFGGKTGVRVLWVGAGAAVATVGVVGLWLLTRKKKKKGRRRRRR